MQIGHFGEVLLFFIFLKELSRTGDNSNCHLRYLPSAVRDNQNPAFEATLLFFTRVISEVVNWLLSPSDFKIGKTF